jgi:3-oxoacyl-[acyl-carrier-protein] synthase-3
MLCKLDNIAIRGMSAAVPDEVIVNTCDQRLIDTIGVYERRSSGVRASDMCIHSASVLLSDLGWHPSTVTHLVFITQTPDYKVPATSCRIVKALDIGELCVAIDINIGCSSFAYGLYVLGSMMIGGRGLLLMGDTNVRCCDPKDTATYPLFGDAGCAVALQYEAGENMYFDFGVRFDEAIKLSGKYMQLDGMKVFLFATKQAPQSINTLMKSIGITDADVDYYTLHQSNRFMNERIRKKLAVSDTKVPYSISEFGNTSCASIVLTMVYKLGNELKNKRLRHIACGFGAGLSWGTVYFTTNKIVCSDLIITV